jgi:hypothetical protein
VCRVAAINQLVIDHEGGNEFHAQSSTLLVICVVFRMAGYFLPAAFVSLCEGILGIALSSVI